MSKTKSEEIAEVTDTEVIDDAEETTNINEETENEAGQEDVEENQEDSEEENGDGADEESSGEPAQEDDDGSSDSGVSPRRDTEVEPGMEPHLEQTLPPEVFEGGGGEVSVDYAREEPEVGDDFDAGDLIDIGEHTLHPIPTKEEIAKFSKASGQSKRNVAGNGKSRGENKIRIAGVNKKTSQVRGSRGSLATNDTPSEDVAPGEKADREQLINRRGVFVPNPKKPHGYSSTAQQTTVREAEGSATYRRGKKIK